MTYQSPTDASVAYTQKHLCYEYKGRSKNKIQCFLVYKLAEKRRMGGNVTLLFLPGNTSLSTKISHLCQIL